MFKIQNTITLKLYLGSSSGGAGQVIIRSATHKKIDNTQAKV